MPFHIVINHGSSLQKISSNAYLLGNDDIRKILSQVPNLEAPEMVKYTELRKHCATVSQIADLTENDLRWLADHMGRNLDVHRNYYRLKDSTAELSKVAKLLLAIDKGHANKFAWEKLSEIKLQGTFDDNIF